MPEDVSALQKHTKREQKRSQFSCHHSGNSFSETAHTVYDLGQQPSKTQTLIKETVNSNSYEKFKKMLKRLFVELFSESPQCKNKSLVQSSCILILFTLFWSWK